MEKFMKVGNIVSGLEVVDVKRVNKLNLIQFLKEVDNYLQEGYRIDVNSARQVGLVLQTDLFKTEEACSSEGGSVASTEAKAVEPKAEEVKETETTAEEIKTSVEQETEAPVENTSVDSKPVEDTAVEPTPVESEKPVKKPTTTRSKKTAQ